MGLFDKKYCDVCGDKIGLLGNRKLEDGNLCKDCASKLSPFFSERKQSTVEEIKQQLAYREENEKQLASFRPTRNYGEDMKVYIDDAAGKFIVTRKNDWKADNPDIISFSQVTSCNLSVDEDKNEIYDKDSEGNRRSFNPPRYQYRYEFYIEINVNSPWFSSIRFQLNSGNYPDSRYTDLYRRYEQEGNELCAALLGRGTQAFGYGAPQQPYGAPQQQYGAPQQTYGAPQQQYGAPQQTYGAPQQQYGAPQQPYGAPQQQYAAPQQPYGAPQQQYGAPQQQYAAPQQSAGAWICGACGARNESGKFCQSCGSSRG